MNARGDLGLWWSTFWTSFVPFLVLVVLMYRFTRRFAPDRALVASAAIGFGTIMLPHAVNLYGHLLAAVLGFAAYAVVSDRRPSSTARLVVGGTLAASAVLVEYQTAIVAIVVFVTVLQRERLRAVLMLAGAVPFALVLALYQWRAFGAPWHTPFAYYTGELNGTSRWGLHAAGLAQSRRDLRRNSRTLARQPDHLGRTRRCALGRRFAFRARRAGTRSSRW